MHQDTLTKNSTFSRGPLCCNQVGACKRYSIVMRGEGDIKEGRSDLILSTAFWTLSVDILRNFLHVKNERAPHKSKESLQHQ